MADIAHPSGLIASKIHPSPWPFCDVITSTTHKTLRGPRGGLILVGKDFKNPWNIVAPKSGRIKKVSELLDSSIMPGIQGGPMMHIIAAKAIAFKEALGENFLEYSKQVVINAKKVAKDLITLGYNLVSGGTDTHVILIDLSKQNITGKLAERSLEEAGITVNKNMVPFDTKSPMVTSGIRIGTPAMTTRGLKEDEMANIVLLIDKVLKAPLNRENIINVRKRVKDMCDSFPLYKDLEI